MAATGRMAWFLDLPVAARVLMQALAVILCAIAGSLIAGNHGAPLNLVWAVSLPVLLAVLLNRGTTNRVVFSGFWIVLSLITIGLVVSIEGFGPD